MNEGHHASTVQALLREAHTARQQGRIAEAREQFEVLLADNLDVSVEAEVRIGLAGVLHVSGLSVEALAQLHLALELRERLGDVEGVAAIHNNLGILLGDLGEYGSALEHLEQAREALRRNPDRLARVLVNLGHVYLQFGDVQRSERATREGLAIVTDQTSARMTVTLTLNLAEALRRRGSVDEACPHYSTVIEQAVRHHMPDLQLRALHGKGLVKAALGEHQESRSVLHEALCLARTIGDLEAELLAMTGLAEVSLSTGKADDALDDSQLVLERARSSQRVRFVLEAHELTARACEMLGDYRRTTEHLRHARETERTLHNAEEARRARILHVKHDLVRLQAERENAVRAKEAAEAKVAQQLEELKQLALYDTLTGLPNRVLFRDRLEYHLSAREEQGLVAVGLLDLDRFKVVNDSLGHATGDELLVEVARRLRQAVRAGDTVARMGGDEFLFALPIGKREDVEVVAGKILDAIKDPVTLGGQEEVLVRGSLGFAVSPEHGVQGDVLLRHADAAMYLAKRAGGGWRTYENIPSGQYVTPLALESALARALKHQHFELHYQPQVNLADSTLVGVESLLRWRDPVRGLMLPGEFISNLEESGLIVEVGAWVLRQACHDIASLGGLHVAVNISARQFQLGDLEVLVREALSDSHLPPERLEVELTESMVMRDPRRATRVLEHLRELGVRVALDDFGTGYSSLSTLRTFPLDVLKVDRTFVRSVHESREDLTVVRTIAMLAHGLNLTTVAEGVESPLQVEAVREAGIDFGQGWHFGRPVTLPDLRAQVEQGRAVTSTKIAR